MTDSPILLYTNQWSNREVFTGAYSKTRYKHCHQVCFYHTGAWIVDWSAGDFRDEWQHARDRMLAISTEKGNFGSAIYGYDMETFPYPDPTRIKIEQALVDGENRFVREAAAFRYIDMVEDMTPSGCLSLAYGIPSLWHRRHDPFQYQPGDPMWKVMEAIDIWAPVMYFRRWANEDQIANLYALVRFRDRFFPTKKIVPHVSPYDSSDGVADMVRLSPEKFAHHQVRKCRDAGADGCIYWDMLHKMLPTEQADEMTEPYLDAMSEWAGEWEEDSDET